MIEEPISLSFAFRPRSNICTDKSAAQSGATLRHMHSRYLPNSNSLYVEHHTEKSLVLLGLWWIRTLSLLNSKRSKYFCIPIIICISIKACFRIRNALFQFQHDQQKLKTTYFTLKSIFKKSITYQFWYSFSVYQDIKDQKFSQHTQTKFLTLDILFHK